MREAMIGAGGKLEDTPLARLATNAENVPPAKAVDARMRAIALRNTIAKYVPENNHCCTQNPWLVTSTATQPYYPRDRAPNTLHSDQPVNSQCYTYPLLTQHSKQPKYERLVRGATPASSHTRPTAERACRDIANVGGAI